MFAAGFVRSFGALVMAVVAVPATYLVGRTVARTGASNDPASVLARTAVVGAIVAVPALFDIGTFDVFGTTKLAVAGLALAVGTVGLLLRTARRGVPAFSAPITIPAVAIVVWTFLSAIASWSWPVAAQGFYKSYDGALLALVLGLFVISVQALFDRRDVLPVLAALVLAGGGLVAAYSALQLHDRWFGGQWDWLDWGEATFREASVWGPFGNPNHLAGFLAVILPIGLVLAIHLRARGARVALGAVGVIAVAALVRTGTRGAWLAVAAGVGVAVLLLAVDLPSAVRRPVRIGGVVAAVVVVLGLAVIGSSGDVSELIQFGPKSTASQRIELWKSALDMAGDRPLLGVGPDGYRAWFPEYQSEGFVAAFGPAQIANGPHNFVLNQLATTGWVGALLLMALLAGAARSLRRGWTTARARETIDRASGLEARLAVTALTGGIVAYIVQASFNVQQVGLSVPFWVLLGLAAVVARPEPSTQIGPFRRPVGPVVVGVGALAAVVLAVFTIRPWFADRAFLDARKAAAGVDAGRANPAVAAEAFRTAVERNGWEAEYGEVEGQFHLGLARERDREGQPTPASRRDLEAARSAFEASLARNERDAGVHEQLSEVLSRLAVIERSPSLRSAAESHLARAIELNPRHERYYLQLAALLAATGRSEEAVERIERGLRLVPESRSAELRARLEELQD